MTYNRERKTGGPFTLGEIQTLDDLQEVVENGAAFGGDIDTLMRLLNEGALSVEQCENPDGKTLIELQRGGEM